MGCDIHSYIEVRNKDFNTGEYSKWELLPIFDTKYSRVPSITNHYTGRDYELFGWLTDGVVRCATQTDLPAPRGFPSDASREIINEHLSWNDSCHSESYFTLLELEDAYRQIPKKVQLEIEGKKEKNPFRKRARWFIDTIRVFVDACGYYTDDEVRIVFWFDS